MAVAGGPDRFLDALRWPNVVGKHCLVLGDHAGAIEALLHAKRAASVEVRDVDDLGVIEGPGGGPGAPDDGADLTVCWGVATRSEAPLLTLRRVHGATRGMVVSIEPVDLVLTVAGRPVPLLRWRGFDGRERHSMNGKAHHRLLSAAGFSVERPSGLVAVADPGCRRQGLVERALGAVLTGSPSGVAHRALFGRAHP